MKRRSFLKLLAGASTALAFPAIVRAQTLGLGGKTAPSGRLAVGLIGAGGHGTAHLRYLVGESRVQVLAVCDPDGVHAEQGKRLVEATYARGATSGRYRGCDTYADLREMLARSDIDAVVAAVPDHWHALAVILSVQAGKDIYAEKPFSLTIPEGRAMVQAVQRTGAVCQVGSQQRSSELFQRAVALVRNGALGKIHRVRVGLPLDLEPRLPVPLPAERAPATFDYEQWLGPAPWAPYHLRRCHYHFRWIYDYSGGHLTDWIGHHFDIAAWAMNKTRTGPIAIRRAKAEFGHSPLYDVPLTYSFEAHYADGTVIEVASAKARTPEVGARFEGADGWIHVSRGIWESNPAHLETIPIPSIGYDLGEGTSHFANYFDCIASRAAPRCPAEEGHRVATVAHLANLAFRTGRSELRWDPEAEKLIDAPDAERLFARDYRAPWQLSV